MYKYLLTVCTLLSLIPIGCGTPPQVKQLSIKQLAYFDTAIEAVSLQSEALILATETLVARAKARIDSTEKKNRARFEMLIQDELSEETAERALNAVSETTQNAIDARKKLDSDLSIIRQKTEELEQYLRKMREVHLALDAYIQSEKAGEAVVTDVLNHSSVKAMLATIDELIPLVEGGIKDVTTLLNEYGSG